MADLVQEATRAAATWLEENEGASPRCFRYHGAPLLLQRGGAGCILPIWGRSGIGKLLRRPCALGRGGDGRGDRCSKALVPSWEVVPRSS